MALTCKMYHYTSIFRQSKNYHCHFTYVSIFKWTEAGLCGETGARVQALVVLLLKHGAEPVVTQLRIMAVHNAQGITHKYMRVLTDHAQV